MLNEMTENDREKLAELISIKVAEKYFKITKEYIQKEIELHTLQCSNRKFSKVLAVVCAVIGGVCVGFFNWLLNK